MLVTAISTPPSPYLPPLPWKVRRGVSGKKEKKRIQYGKLENVLLSSKVRWLHCLPCLRKIIFIFEVGADNYTELSFFLFFILILIPGINLKVCSGNQDSEDYLNI